VGSFLDNGEEVVQTTGDRVVTLLPTGQYQVYRNDDVVLYQPGSTVRTETFSDGSTRTFLTREDSTQVVTIQDATGRVLRRSRLLEGGTEVQLFNDIEPQAAQPVNVINLIERAPPPVVVSSQDLNYTELAALIRQEPTYDPGPELLAAADPEHLGGAQPGAGIDLEINFLSGSAAIPGQQLQDLVEIGILIEDTLADNPAEVFLIEGHTDATGGDALNLRSRTVARSRWLWR
jgi:outer membrane protein OmpA-like peptidoglycan-associated protein